MFVYWILLQGGKVIASVDGQVVANGVSVPATSGYVGFGTSGYFAAEFDTFTLSSGRYFYAIFCVCEFDSCS